jgi:iron complex outermembrane receptor protein
MSRLCWSLALVAAPVFLVAQQPSTPRTHADSAHRADSVARQSARLRPVTIVTTPVERAEPSQAIRVSAAALQMTPATNPWDLLRQTSGIEVHLQGQGPGFASDASMRGFSSDHSTDLALWIDGVPINEPVNGHAEGYSDWSVIFPDAVQDIDVIKGPTSTLFGNFALAGVVNVRTLERMTGTRISASAGAYGRAEASVLTGFDHGPRGGGVFGARVEREDGFRPNSRYNVVQGHARVVHDVTPGTSIDGGVELYDGDWRSPGFLGEDEFVKREYSIVSNPSDAGYKRRAQARVSLRTLASTSLWRTTLYATRSRWQLFLTIPPAGGKFEGTGSQTEENDDRYGLGLTSAVTWTHSRGEVTLGSEGRWDHSNYDNYFTTDRQRDSAQAVATGRQLSGALFAQAATDVTTRVRVSAGVRGDALRTTSTPESESSLSATRAVLSPKVGAALLLAPAVRAYGNFSRGFRATDGVVVDPTLPVITAWSYETGLKLDHAGASASIALFRMNVSNEQTFNPIARGSSSGGTSRRQGLELGWQVPFAGLITLSGDWTINDAIYTSQIAIPEDPAEAPVVLTGRRVYNTARYVGSSAATFAKAGWHVHVSGNWVGDYSPFDEPGVVVGGYGLLHADAGIDLKGTRLDVGLRNALDRQYAEVIAGNLVAPGQPRSVYASLRLRL